MAEAYVGQILLVGFNFAPQGWAHCNGQLLPIAQNAALFSLLGTTYGGDGRVTFDLPDLRGRVPIHQGQGTGLSPRMIGEVEGTETVTLTTTQIPAHRHTLTGSSAPQHSNKVAGAALAKGGIYNHETPEVAMHPQALAETGGGQPHPNLQPSLCINFIIALEGIYPSRS